MPDSTLSQAIKEAFAAASPDIVYHTIELSHPDIETPLRVVQGHENLAAGGYLWTAAAFELTLPQADASGDISMQLRIDNVGGEVLAQIEEVVEKREPMTVVYRAFVDNVGGEVLAQNDPPTELQMTAISVTRTTITATCTLAPLQNRRWPRVLYTDDEFPGLIT